MSSGFSARTCLPARRNRAQFGVRARRRGDANRVNIGAREQSAVISNKFGVVLGGEVLTRLGAPRVNGDELRALDQTEGARMKIGAIARADDGEAEGSHALKFNTNRKCWQAERRPSVNPLNANV